jgi:hypothetical protein
MKFSLNKNGTTGKKETKKEKPATFLKEKVSQVSCLNDKSHGKFEKNVLEIIMTWKQFKF